MRKLHDIVQDQRGGTMIEYGLILALIFVVMMVSVHAMADVVVGTFYDIRNQVVNASSV